MSSFLTDWQRHSAVLAAAREAKRKPPVWSLVPIGLLVYIAGTIAASVCLIPVLLIWAGLGGGMEQMLSAITADPVVLMLAMNIPIMAVFILYMGRIERRPLRSMGFTRGGTLRRYLAGLGWGALMILAAAGIACAFGGLRFAGFGQGIQWGLWLLIFAGFLFQGMSEEVMCRGFLMVSAANRAPLWVGVALNSLIFAALHLFNTGVTALSVVNLILYALFASFYFLRTDSIWGIGALHASWNFVQGCVLGIGVSGIPVPVTAARFIPAEGSAEAIGGGRFGLEGSIAATLVLAAGILLLAVLPYNRDGRKKTHADEVSAPANTGSHGSTDARHTKSGRIFRLIGWSVVVLSLVGLASCLNDVLSGAPAAQGGFLLSFIQFAMPLAAGVCLLVADKCRTKKTAQERNSAAPDTAKPTEYGSEREDGTGKQAETASCGTPLPATANAAPVEEKITGTANAHKMI